MRANAPLTPAGRRILCEPIRRVAVLLLRSPKGMGISRQTPHATGGTYDPDGSCRPRALGSALTSDRRGQVQALQLPPTSSAITDGSTSTIGEGAPSISRAA